MGDSGWMRLLPGQRCRTPVSSSSSHQSPYDHHHHPLLTSEDSLESSSSNPHHLRISPRPLVGFYHSASDADNDILVREADRLQNTPSVDEMADILRTAIMVAPTPPTLGPQYTSHVLHVIEGYSKLRTQLSRAERDVARLEAARQDDKERSKAHVAEWAAQEARFRAEVKRLELIIQKVSGRGVEAVALARSGSLIRRGAAAAAVADRGNLVDDNEVEREDDFGLGPPRLQVEDGQGRRTSSFCDNFDTTARLNTTRQLWRHRSENNLLDPSRKGTISPNRRQDPVLLHPASPQRPSKLEPDGDCGLADEKPWTETDVDK
ncbi:hypothetical protein BBK36DRAFT_1126264 [Trichoderma citrinoviride]|uniref:Uncharacterized protein n=1 Tax=Trichoderma citrinoviride TaxID=58853 RepID=A0A2T4B2M7_9HYPO|nr:hypothetical protein BBK36DRAFT_1126264 [Trichoderma citrinoviride]PTB63576.1 hypothetical protein BBK36DRAFT_1126264 [Trichoderma citrinoviride]